MFLQEKFDVSISGNFRLFSNFKLKVILIVLLGDGRWSPWGPYNECSKSCGVGFTTRSGKCTNQNQR